jgi:hypothetical protein
MKAEEESYFLWSAQELASNFPAKLLKEAAKNANLNSQGIEAEVAQRLLEIGWRPPKRGLPTP